MNKGLAEQFLETFGAILKHSNYDFVLDHFSGLGNNCGRCSVGCHVYAESKKIEDTPCYRSELLLQTYRRHFTTGGFLQARVLGTHPLVDSGVEEMSSAFYRCSTCARCSEHCPMGVDHEFVTHLGRYVLSEMGLAPKSVYAEQQSFSQFDSSSTADWIAEHEKNASALVGRPLRLPFDRLGCEYAFFPGATDDLGERNTIAAEIAVLEKLGVSYSVSEATLRPVGESTFHNDRWIEKAVLNVVKETQALGAKKILVGECGHMATLIRRFASNFGGAKIPIVHLCDLTEQELSKGKIASAKASDTRRVTYHDPCRFTGVVGMLETPRKILSALVPTWFELSTSGKESMCCEAKDKIGQLRDSGAEVIVSASACCRQKLRKLVRDNHLGLEVMGVHEFVVKNAAGGFDGRND